MQMNFPFWLNILKLLVCIHNFNNNKKVQIQDIKYKLKYFCKYIVLKHIYII